MRFLSIVGEWMVGVCFAVAFVQKLLRVCLNEDFAYA